MALFGLGKKKEEEKSNSCCCGGGCEPESTAKEEINNVGEAINAEDSALSIKVLGSGCAKCNQLEASVKAALEQLGMDTKIEHVTDFSEIAAYGVMSTPALVVDGKVVSYGKVLKVDEVIKILKH